MDEASVFYAKDRAAWRQWLKENHTKEKGVWLIYDKGAARTMAWEDIVQEALCFGWIDSRPAKLSETQSKIYVSKRNAKSAWSKINKEHAAYLLKAGLMPPAGQVVIDEAQRNGAWDALSKSDALEMPPEMIALFDKDAKAKRFYDAMPPSSKKLILEWIYSAKKEETQRARIMQTVELAAIGIKAHHYRQ